MDSIHIVGLFILNLPVFLLLGKVFFGSFARFRECVQANMRLRRGSHLFRPDYGAQNSDQTQSFVLALYFIVCGALVFGEIYLLNNYVLQ